MQPNAGAKPARRRARTRESRRSELIHATIRSVAKRGFAATKMADVTREAGLSQGIVNLHFESKDELFVETLRQLAEEYQQAWRRALERAGPDPAGRIAALVDLDFSATVCDRNKLAVWFAFWGEAKSRPTYRKICERADREYDNVLADLCAELAEIGGYAAVDAGAVAATLAALTDGLWLDILITPEQMDRKRARILTRAYLAGVFPEHFHS